MQSSAFSLLSIPPTTSTFYMIPLFILTCFAFSKIVPYDSIYKKVIFILALFIIRKILNENQQTSSTATFLISIVIVQILALAAVAVGSIRFAKWFFEDFVQKKKIKQLEWKIIAPFAVLLLALTSIVGLFISVIMEYYLQLIVWPQLLIMLLIVVVGFIVVNICDQLIVKYSRHQSMARRKTFHFVPVLLMPILSIIHYRLFSLMAIGSFYLFWLAELFRYFCKMARKSIINEGEYRNECLAQENSNHQKFIKKSEDRKNYLRILTFNFIEKFDKLNYKLADLTLAKWMQELNSTREPHFWFTHLSLILGLSLTFIYYPPSNSIIAHHRYISLILIMADAMAALIGRKYGSPTRKIPLTNGKTFEGFLAFVLTAFILQIFCILLVHQYITFLDCCFFFISSIICGIGELYSGDMDNIVAPLMFVGLQRIWVGFY